MSVKVSYNPSFVAFLDILGFSALIQHTDDSENKEKTISELTDAFESAKKSFQSHVSWEKDKLSVRMFSDCICISVPAIVENFDAFFQILALVQSNFVRRRICLRGGIAIGKHFENEYLIFSEGLIKAHAIESSVAQFPRIVVPREFWDFIISNGMEEDIIWFKDTYIWIDPTDGRQIIDYLNFMPYTRRDEPNHEGRDLKNHKKFIEESIKRFETDERIVAKYKWMAAYHNSWCRDQYPQYPDLIVNLKVEESN